MSALAFFMPLQPLQYFRRTENVVPTRDDTLARRDFIRDMIDTNPDAFASELDVYEMMSHLPGKF